MSDIRPSQREAAEAHRPDRPALVELASAVLVVGGATSILGSVDVLMRLAEQSPGFEPLGLLSIAIGIASVIVGFAVRMGHWWLLALNAVAVAAFLELTSGTVIGLVFGALDLFVVLVLLLERPWFTWAPDADDRSDPRDRAR